MAKARAAAARPRTLPISVVIPAYNAQACLAEALQSIATQTAAPSEVIVVDDGSTDATAALARDHGVRVITQANAGVSAARNAGVAAAASPWIAFLDADDHWFPERLAAQWKAITLCSGARIAASDYTVYGNPATAVARFMLRWNPYRGLARRPVVEDAVFLDGSDVARALTLGNFFSTSTLLVARSLFIDDGVWYRSRAELPNGVGVHVGEDFEWMLRALLHSDLVVVERPLADYRRWAQNASARTESMRLGDIVLGEYVRAMPWRYASGAAEAFARIRPLQLRRMGYGYLALGDAARAHSMFARSAHEGDRPSRTLAAITAWLAGPTGQWPFALVWSTWRKLVRPVVHWARRCR